MGLSEDSKDFNFIGIRALNEFRIAEIEFVNLTTVGNNDLTPFFRSSCTSLES